MNAILRNKKTFATLCLSLIFSLIAWHNLLQAADEPTPSGLVLWNKLGSDDEVLNSAYGPELTFYTVVDEGPVQIHPQYIPGKYGDAVTLNGKYVNLDRTHSLVLNDLPQVIDPEQGTIELWYWQAEGPVIYSHGAYRLFDGAYGSGDDSIGLHVIHAWDSKPARLELFLGFGGTTRMVWYDAGLIPNNQWVHLAASWDRLGIGGTAETMQLYVDGVKVAATTFNDWGNVVGARADICGGSDDNMIGKFAMDNLIVWDHAMTDFAHRFSEEPIILKLVGIGSVLTGESYALARADMGAKAYIDRDYTILGVTSGLSRGVLVQTANDDKWVTAEEHLVLRFFKDAMVYVCYDRRATILPTWLQAWRPSDESISTTDSPASPMKVYWKSVAAGEVITLGGNHAGGDTGARSNYLVVVQPFSVEIMNVSTGKHYALSKAEAGVRAYIDRDYGITQITSGLNGGALVQTANDDKQVAAEKHLTLRFSNAVMVYVCYDKRGKTLPAWLQNWTPTGESISTNDSPASPMKVYWKSVAEGEEITLGGNHAGGDTGARSSYLVIVQPFPVQIMHVASERSYALSKAEIGAKVYIDRDYTITGITPGLNKGVLVQTANDDKRVYLEYGGFLNLRILRDAKVYVCWDKRGSNALPTWLQDWTLSGESISTTDSPASPMKVYWIKAVAYEEISLGGTDPWGDEDWIYTGAESNYFVIVRP